MALPSVLAEVLRGIALNRTPGYHFPIHFLDLSFDSVSREETHLSMAPGPHCIDATGHLHMGALALLADLSMSASMRAGRDPSTRTATVSMTVSITGVPPEGRVGSTGGVTSLVIGGRGEQGSTRFIMRSGQGVIAHGGGSFMVLDPPPGVKLLPVTMRKHGDPLPPPIAPASLTAAERPIYAHAEEALAHAARDGGAFIDHFWGGRGKATPEGAAAELVNGAFIANRVKHIQGGILFGFASSTAALALAGTDSGGWRITAATAAFIAPGEGVRIVARSTIVHRGRLTAVVHTRIERLDGKLVLDLTSHHAALA